MREIKFRAWDKVEKRYFYDVQNVYDSGEAPCCCSAFGHFLSVMIEDEETTCDSDEHRFDVEQFTGLHDKNGKEIYEGDVVSVENSDGRTNVEVIFDEQRSWFAGFCIIYPDKSVTVLGDYQLAEIDAVLCGNIHENPELLNAH